MPNVSQKVYPNKNFHKNSWNIEDKIQQIHPPTQDETFILIKIAAENFHDEGGFFKRIVRTFSAIESMEGNFLKSSNFSSLFVHNFASNEGIIIIQVGVFYIPIFQKKKVYMRIQNVIVWVVSYQQSVK